MLNNIRIILIETSHPGNIGAAARAMKTMGLTDLCLVSPEATFPCHTATAMAAGADDLLENAHICQTLDEAVADCHLIIGTSARLRNMPIKLVTAAECSTLVIQQAPQQKIALLFGRENSGLTNDELNRCHYHVNIPSNEAFSSLNLAASVQVLCYEIRMAYLSLQDYRLEQDLGLIAAADHEVQLFFQRLEVLLTNINFIQERGPQKIMPRLRRIFNRTQLEKPEIDLLLGILTQLEKQLMLQSTS